ncbi:addiction module protein [Candidatus Magnetomorum sp. HK-1]|nr:addiction module protein [Candidatus Magnetomorum sp. HK-1]
MSKTNELYNQAISLPIEDRVILADLIIKSFNSPNYSNDLKWITIAKNRLNELRSEKVKPIPGHIVFQKIKDRLSV